MKFIDDLIKKFGDDKVEHYLGGGWIVALATPFGWCGVIVSSIFTLAISLFKEQYLDDKFDVWDIVAAMAGAATSAAIFGIISLIV